MTKPTDRPEDLDTGLWLWAVALPLMVAAFLIDVATLPVDGHRVLVFVFAVMGTLVLASLVLAFLYLLRHGYRWARTALTSGGVISVVHSVSSLITGDREAAAAVGYAVTAIVGSVLIVGGIYLLHREDATGYLTR